MEPAKARRARLESMNESAVLDGLLDGARSGQSGVLVLRAQAEVGKTALLEYAVRSAPDMRVLRTAGVEPEMELAFAALHRLCGPLLDRLDSLPGPHRDALRTTFGLSAGAVPDRFFVGLAVLGLLSAAADESPLLCVVDDAQWLDRGSAQALAFVARRMLALPVVMLFAAREPNEALADLPEMVLDRLGDTGARALLASLVPFDVTSVEAFAVPAERELLAASELVRNPRVEAIDELTAQEAQIAALARDGLSNVEIGGRLFISQHTVAYHLRKVFSKLEITSRYQLERVLPDEHVAMSARVT